MRIAFVSIPRFACAVELQRQPSLAHHALIVGDAEQPRRVLDCSAAASRHGVRPGLPIRQALSNCPEAVILPPDPVLYQSKWDSVLEALDAISPEVEDEEPGRAYLNVRGLPPIPFVLSGVEGHQRPVRPERSRRTPTPPFALSGVEGHQRPVRPERSRRTPTTTPFVLSGVEGPSGVEGRGTPNPDDALAAAIVEAVLTACGLEASVGLANGKFAALAAAARCRARECAVVSPGEEAAFLAPLDIDLLPVDSEIVFRLRILGLDRIGDVARLTVPELQSQFGFEGKRLWQLTNGIDEEPLRPRKRTDVLQTSVNLDTAVAGIDVMIAIARQLLSRLRMSLQGRAARELTLQAELESGRGWQHHLVFREPVSEAERLSFLLRSALTNFPPPQAIRSLSLRLSSLTGETGKQLSLGQRGRRQRQLEEVIRQLKTRYGYSPVYRCVDVEPWSVIPEERQILVESDA
jgi:nucleotidyltransferase/DNA polymerase involved in DNA repair